MMIRPNSNLFILTIIHPSLACSLLFFFNDTATTEIYTLSLHDALPIYGEQLHHLAGVVLVGLAAAAGVFPTRTTDRKSTRLNSSHQIISYAVFCLKKKKNISTAEGVDIHVPILLTCVGCHN